MLNRMKLFYPVLALFVFVYCADAQEPIKAQPERVTSDTPRTTPDGTTFTVPNSWSITQGKSMVLLAPPETDTRVALVDVQAVDAKSAVNAAWAAFKPDFNRPLKIVTPLPARNGWEERQNFSYETSPNERATVVGIAYRFGKNWTVALLDGSDMTVEKRNSQIGLILQSLRPKGYERESFAGRKPHALDAERVAQVKAFVENSMKELGVPGASIALVDHGKLVFEGGFGLRELGKPEKVDENTLFMAASNTKGMTTLLLSELVDEKKLRWDEPVVEAYPAFKLGDPETTKRVLIKNLICACTGMPRQDLEWIFEFRNATPDSSLKLLGTMQPTSKFGEVFQYSNLMAAAAGYVGAHLIYPNKELGAAYDEAMQKKIFDPLGMNSTTFSMSRALKGNHASPHGEDIDGRPSVADMGLNYSIAPHRPAGGVWTTAQDLIRYVQLELAQGKLPNGKQLVSPENLLARRAPQVMVSEDISYGMGLEVDTRYKVPVVYHGGSLAGYKSNIYIFPDAGIGAVLLTNADTGGFMLTPFMRRLLEIIYDGKPEAAGDVTAAAQRHKATLAKERERLVLPPDGAAAARLARHYHNEALGDIAVSSQNGAVTFDFGEWKSKVASRKNDDGTISFITIDPSNDGFDFVVSERSGKKALVIRDGQHEYVFTETT